MARAVLDNTDIAPMEAGFDFLPLTADDDTNDTCYCGSEPACVWMDDCEVQENLFEILPLTPEESCVDADNHIHSTGGILIFFEELGYLTEEPEPIDPYKDYDAEAKAMLDRRNGTRRKHIELSVAPSLDESNSGLSSASSSFHYTDTGYTTNDLRTPHLACFLEPSTAAHLHPISEHMYPHHASPLRTPCHPPL